MPTLLEVPAGFENAWIVGARNPANPRFAGIEPCAGGRLIATVGEAQSFRDEVLVTAPWSDATLETLYRTMQRPIKSKEDARVVKVVSGFDREEGLSGAEVAHFKQVVDRWESTDAQADAYVQFLQALRQTTLGRAQQFLRMEIPSLGGTLSFLEFYMRKCRLDYAAEYSESLRIWNEESLRLDYKAGIAHSEESDKSPTIHSCHGSLEMQDVAQYMGEGKQRFILSGSNGLGCIANWIAGHTYYACIHNFPIAWYVPLAATVFRNAVDQLLDPEEKHQYVCRLKPNYFERFFDKRFTGGDLPLTLPTRYMRTPTMQRYDSLPFRGYAITFDGAFVAGAGDYASVTLNWFSSVDSLAELPEFAERRIS